MPAMPGDIFISYARKDDQTAHGTVGAKGLVASLHARLLAKFDELGTPRPTIFRDTQHIDKADQFEPRLGQALRDAKVLVVVLSRNWLESEWCKRELDTFVEHGRERNESEVAIRERIVLVRKHAIAPDARPTWLQGQSGYDLLQVDPETNEELEYFDSDFGRPCQESWFTRTAELAKDLRRRASSVVAPPDKPTAPLASQPATGRTLFVARPALDMEQSCATLVEELIRRGFRVVPDPAASLPGDGPAAIAAIGAALEAAELSVHLIGERLGFQPEGARPIVKLQLESAGARAGGPSPRAFHRLIWAPRVMPGATEGVARDPFEVLGRHSALCHGDKLDGDTLTKFIQFVLQHLDEIGRPTAPSLPAVAAGAQIYVQHDERDAAAAENVAEALGRLGFAPVLPALEGDAAARLRVHRDALQTADAVLLCWAEAADVWVRAGASELRRWQDLGRTNGFVCRSVLALPPPRPAKDRLRKFPPKSDVDGVIDATATADVTGTTLDPLLRPLLGGAP